jgi:methylenetetrahydrofolate dehydrogenase (NADP+)/methenyltetrahydrofolate cyclohydrolase
MTLLSGYPVSESILSGIKEGLKAPLKRAPKLVFILVGQHLPSQTYVKMKAKACQNVGIHSQLIELNANISLILFKELIKELNEDETVDGIIVQMPLPKGLEQIPFLIDPKKDVDGFTAHNMGKLALGDLSGLIPCTPQGIFYLLRHYNISCEGRHVAIMGRSSIVGKPLANLLSLKLPYANATVSLLHAGSKDVKSITTISDILIVAIGQRETIDASYIKQGAVVIDVGIHRHQGRIVGDCDLDSIKQKAKAYSPVPGGVGPMTIACLLLNTYSSYKQKFKDVGSSHLVFQDHLLLRT